MLLYCDWHKTNLVGNTATLKKDPITGLYRIRKDSILRSDRQTDEPLIYPRMVRQCIFIDAHVVDEGLEGVEWMYGIPYTPRSQQVIQAKDPKPVISEEVDNSDEGE